MGFRQRPGLRRAMSAGFKERSERMRKNEVRPFREEVRRFYVGSGPEALPLGMGGAAIGSAADLDTYRRFQATLEAAYAGGIRYFDTSRQYGGSEFRLGRFLRTIDRSTVFVATKAPIPTPLTPEEAALHVRQCLYNSLERLGLETIDLFQVHDVTTLDQVLAPGGALETLIEAREAGRIRYIGLGTRWHDLLETAAAHGAFDTILTFVDYTLINQSAARLIEFAAGRGVGVLHGSPLAFGVLTGEDPRTNPHLAGEYRRYVALAAKIYDFCQERGLPLLALAQQYPLRNPHISLSLTGPGSPEELRATLEACRREIPPQVWQELNRRFGIPVSDGMNSFAE